MTENIGDGGAVSAGRKSKGRFRVQLEDGTMYDEAVSALQKMIRRGLEEDALFVAIGLFDSGYGMALARRLPAIAGEDIGLAAPDIVEKVCSFCVTWMHLKKVSQFQPDSLLLVGAVMMM